MLALEGMLRTRTFHRRTRRGRVLKVVREHYLRDDIACGCASCKRCHILDGSAAVALSPTPFRGRYLLLDTNVILHQIDLLEQACPALCDVIIPQTVMQEVRHRHLGIYNRLHSLVKDDARRFFVFANEHHRETYADRLPGETPNDYCDRCIRAAAAWYAKHLAPAGIKVQLVTNDRANAERARTAELQACSVHALVEGLKQEFPTLSEVLAASRDDAPARTAAAVDGAAAEGEDAEEGGGLGPQRALFPQYLPAEEVQRGLRAGRLFQGCLRTSARHWLEGVVNVKGLNPHDRDAPTPVSVQGRRHLNRAVDGDIVAVELLPADGEAVADAAGASDSEDEAAEAAEAEARSGGGAVMGEAAPAVAVGNDSGGAEGAAPSEEAAFSSAPGTSRPRGRVVAVIKRNWRAYCGTIEPARGRVAGDRAMFVPVNPRVPKIRIRTRQRAALENMRIIVAIDAWDAHSKHPDGHYVRTLGEVGDKAVETEVILIEHDIPSNAFSAKVLACLPPEDWAITPENSEGRKDLRDVCVFSIDPPGCKDIDDALHCRRLPDGHIEVGVHIADVAYFVSPGSALDEEAASRATSTYLVERRLDMLPGLLTETLCSVRANEDKFVFSVVWRLTNDAEVVSTDFHRSIVYSRAALTYGQAQDMLDDPAMSGPVPEGVRLLNHVARILRRRRVEAGALTLASPEVRFAMDQEKNPTGVEMYALKETNALVEEFMLFANCAVAEKILHHFPNLAVLRRHPEPTQHNFDSLVSAAAAEGVKLETETSLQLAQSLDRAVKAGNPYFNKLLRILATRCMTQAEYFCSGELPADQFKHYGLAAPIYTHFTSPIRRYADVMVHRLLAAALGLAPLPAEYRDKAFMHDQCSHMNQRHLMAQLAGRASVELYTKIFFKSREVEEDAHVMRVQPTGCVVLVPRFGVETAISLRPKSAPLTPTPDMPWVYDAETNTLRHYQHPERVLRVLRPVRVRITVEDKPGFRDQVCLRLLWPEDSGAAAEGTAEPEAAQAPAAKRHLQQGDTATAQKKRQRR